MRISPWSQSETVLHILSSSLLICQIDKHRQLPLCSFHSCPSISKLYLKCIYYSTVTVLAPTLIAFWYILTISLLLFHSTFLFQTGTPLLYFGDGQCSANAISEVDLADYLVDCALNPVDLDMLNQTRDIGTAHCAE